MTVRETGSGHLEALGIGNRVHACADASRWLGMRLRKTARRSSR